MGILDNARYAEIGKKAEARKLADSAVAAVAPHIEKEAVRKYAPVIQEQAAKGVLEQLGRGLAAYASNDGITVPQGVNVTNGEMDRARSIYGNDVNMNDILDMRKMDSLPAVNNGSVGAAPDGGLDRLPAEGLGMLGIRGDAGSYVNRYKG